MLFEYTPEHSGEAVDTCSQATRDISSRMRTSSTIISTDRRRRRGQLLGACRRYFFKALASDPERAKVALSLIGQLFRIERAIATAPRKRREKIRQKHSAPMVERFFSWCEAEWPGLLEDTPLHDGVRYARNQREGLIRFLDDGRFPIHNNVSERELRRQAVGRKNWLFVGSEDGAQANATFTSLLASCRMVGIEPWAYLRDLFCLLPDWPDHRVLELAPAYWVATLSTDDVRRRLDADPFRALTLERG